MSIINQIQQFVAVKFKTTLETFLEALKISPNAQGYVNGSITELLLKQHLENNQFEVLRIKEKWEGLKHPKHHGDLYIKKNQTDNWYVVESKGVKSNTEIWNKLYNYSNLKKFLYDHNEIISWIDHSQDIELQIEQWLGTNLPEVRTWNTIYSFEEIRKYLASPPRRETEKLVSMRALSAYSRTQIEGIIRQRIIYLHTKLMVLDTHFVSGTSGASERTQATPRKDEFNIISIDIVLRYNEHKFLFANPQHLDSSGKDENHLQQNYIMGIVFPQENGQMLINLYEDWYDNIDDVYNTLDVTDSVQQQDMQIDLRRDLIE